MSVEKRAHAASGWVMLGVVILGYLASPLLLLWSIIRLNSYDGSVSGGLTMMLLSCLLFVATIIASCGFFTLQPGQAQRLSIGPSSRSYF